ncbi:hypothetical protein HZH68_016507 [Vespula germanica]|uniref:Uncharacterized protein n=1 Tax=Vespula germanica TaxID=30212 RepID=A0A834MPN2_VESGE|nr:hypothetical protein HZH68_016507 [Vespula germanica]
MTTIWIRRRDRMVTGGGIKEEEKEEEKRVLLSSLPDFIALENFNRSVESGITQEDFLMVYGDRDLLLLLIGDPLNSYEIIDEKN